MSQIQLQERAQAMGYWRELESVVDDARVALAGDSNDDEHDALAGLFTFLTGEPVPDPYEEGDDE